MCRIALGERLAIDQGAFHSTRRPLDWKALCENHRILQRFAVTFLWTARYNIFINTVNPPISPPPLARRLRGRPEVYVATGGGLIGGFTVRR